MNGGNEVPSIFPLVQHLTILEAIFGWCVNTVIGNAILMIMFVVSLLLIGFKIFKRAKKSARS